MITRQLPRKLTELGRLRIGDREPNKKGGGTHPHKLLQFRLTSSNKPLLEYAARHPDIGGEVREWEDAPGDGKQWELYTETDTLEVVIPTFSAISLTYELWSSAGCERRCSGECITHCSRNEELVGTACMCPEDDQERAALAKDGKACARVLRLNVMLPDLPGAGFWRLDTKGFYATAELLGTLDLLKQAGAEHMLIEASLRLEQRQVKRPGKGEGKGTLNFVVPVLWPKYTFRQIAAARQSQETMLLVEKQKSLATHVSDLYGDTPAIESRPVVAGYPQSEPLDEDDSPEPPSHRDGNQLPIEAQITEFILANGGTDSSVKAWWARQRKKHADLSPGYLSYLFGQLQDEVQRRKQAQAEPSGVAQSGTVSRDGAGQDEDDEDQSLFSEEDSAALDRELSEETF